eukprot:sb/3479076/
MTWSSADGKVVGYVNGTEELTVEIASSKDTPIVNTEEGKLIIGMGGYAYGSSWQNPYQGYITDLMWLKKQLTEEEVKNLYDGKFQQPISEVSLCTL